MSEPFDWDAFKASLDDAPSTTFLNSEDLAQGSMDAHMVEMGGERPRWWLWNIYGEWVETKTPNPYAQVHLIPGGDNHGVVFGTTETREARRDKLIAAAMDAQSGSWAYSHYKDPTE